MLHRVLYPNAHGNGFLLSKKKRRTSFTFGERLWQRRWCERFQFQFFWFINDGCG